MYLEDEEATSFSTRTYASHRHSAFHSRAADKLRVLKNPCVYLASDYAHPTPRGGSCRIRVYLPDDPQDAWVVICSELLVDRGQSVTEAAARIAAEVLVAPDQPHLVRIEHHPLETTDVETETFDLVTLNSYEVLDRDGL